MVGRDTWDIGTIPTPVDEVCGRIESFLKHAEIYFVGRFVN
jgi:hypothetical protein